MQSVSNQDTDQNGTTATVVVMGATGTGKSAFIHLLTKDSNIRVGHSPESETFEVIASQYVDKATGINVILADTPGFDDSRQGVTDTDTLRRIANWLQDDGVRKLNGIIFMHRISDPRMGASSKKNLRMFQELCGDKNLGHVFIVTTNWTRVGEQEGNAREAALAKGVFKPLIDGGAILLRHDKELDSAESIMSQIIRKEPIVTRFQEELSSGVALGDTAAGAVVTEEIRALKEKHTKELAELRKELEEAARTNQGALRAEIALERRALERKMSRVGEDYKKLQLTMEEEKWQRQGVTAKGSFEYIYPQEYPPHLKLIPKEDQKGAFQIFDFKSLAETTAMLFIQPDLLFPNIRNLAPNMATGKSMQAIEEHNIRMHNGSRNNSHEASVPFFMRDMYYSKNIGLRKDWYTDAAFAQQHFTGTNATTIRLAPPQRIHEFKTAAHAQRRADVTKLLEDNPKSLYMQDYTHFRSAAGIPEGADITCEGRHSCAAIALFHLENGGALHPVGIVLDYRNSFAESVTIFNRRITSTSPGDESSDWPWRYAKTCVQVSDWMLHEVTIHLTHTHFVEEVIIVSAHRHFDPYHVVFKLLEPHWLTTLPLNKAARETLVPKIINTITGFSPQQTYAFIKDGFRRFNWTDLYIPNDLRKRGFPVEELNTPKYHNYGYARNILCMWQMIHKFVSSVLTEAYMGGDTQVANDADIAAFCREIRTAGQLPSFPEIKTLNELIDAVTMCIHIASPQHTAVNYLQQYYQTFVPNKPSSLNTPFPRSLSELQGYGEQDLVAALPVRVPRDWLLMAQVPYLLSFEVSDDSTILHYATSTSESRTTPEVIRNAARVLRTELEAFASTTLKYSQELDCHQQTPYLVLDPRKTAISILI